MSVTADYMVIEPNVQVSFSVASDDEVDQLENSIIAPSKALKDLNSDSLVVQPPLSTAGGPSPLHDSSAQSGASKTQLKESQNLGGWPTTKLLTLMDNFFQFIDEQFVEHAKLLGIDEEKLCDKYHLQWCKVSTTLKESLWNIYQQYYQQNQEQEHTHLSDLPLYIKDFVARCVDCFKEDLGEDDYHSFLIKHAELNSTENPKSNRGLKRGIAKYMKSMQDLVSGMFLNLTFPKANDRQTGPQHAAKIQC